MKTLMLSLMLITAGAQAAIPKHVELAELVNSKWCATRRAEDRTDKFVFAKGGRLTVQTFLSSGTIEKVRQGSWNIENGKLNVALGGRRDRLGFSIGHDGNLLSLSSGTKAVACE